ncbi:MAG TPA: cytochrome P450 [Myxococcota bacterium]|nr:cytochrome P450 [Myxococcales bacterium]HPG26389.1 cytochrome P450 [Myxococcota bacterium]
MSAAATTPPDEGPNLADPDLYRDGTPHAVFADLRRRDPVYWNAESADRGFWSILRYDDIVEVSKNPATFSSTEGINLERVIVEATADAQAPNLISIDPPIHVQYRNSLKPAFSPARLRTLEEGIRERTARILDRIEPDSEIDLVESLSAELPIRVLAALFGTPEDDWEQIFHWSNVFIGADDPELCPSQEEYIKSAIELTRYGIGLFEDRRRTGSRDDIVGLMAHAEVDGRAFEVADFASNFGLLVVAGNETTRNAISGGVLALLEHPDQYRKLVDEPGRIAHAVKELVRFVTPVLHMRRTATRDVELRGKQIREGDRVVMWYAAANRDESIWRDPDVFDVTRKGRPHLGFGIGQHFCLGSRLAEMELRIVFEELLGRFPRMELAAPPRRLRSNFIAGIKALRVHTGPRA